MDWDAWLASWDVEATLEDEVYQKLKRCAEYREQSIEELASNLLSDAIRGIPWGD